MHFIHQLMRWSLKDKGNLAWDSINLSVPLPSPIKMGVSWADATRKETGSTALLEPHCHGARGWWEAPQTKRQEGSKQVVVAQDQNRSQKI